MYAVLVSRAVSARSFAVRVARSRITIRIARMFSSATPMPTNVSCGSYVYSSTAYSTTTIASTPAADRSRASVSATASLDCRRCTRSAGLRWEKNVTGSRSRWRRNRALDSVDEISRPRSRFACWSQVSSSVSRTQAPIDANSTSSIDVCCPIRNSSMKVRLRPGSAAPTATSSRLVSTTAGMVPAVPRSRAGIAPSTPGLRPPRVKSSPGSITSTTPVKLPSNSSSGTNRRPLAGSLTYTPRRPKRWPMPS